jgi:hypothetical protein
MLKILLLLECDHCNGVEVASPDAKPIDGTAWAAAAEDLLYSAQQLGWDIHRTYTCDSCIIDAQYLHEQSRA